MPSLRDLRRRIRTVANTQKITKAMELVAASKLIRQEIKEIMTIAITIRNPIGPMAVRNTVTTGSVSWPERAAGKSGIPSTRARQTSVAANAPM